MVFGVGRFALIGAAVVAALGALASAFADENQPYPAYDISWPQCPEKHPWGDFSFAIIGLNDGRPFTQNGCFEFQYRWASIVQDHPDVYINVDFPRLGAGTALTGPYGVCPPTDDGWCVGYNWGYNLAKDTMRRAATLGITPGRFWLDVETENHWGELQRNNAQVVRGAIDYFLNFNVPIGIYSTRYQWGLITGGYRPAATLPVWVAGATDAADALSRCYDPSFAFAGGVVTLSQYPEGEYDGNVKCPGTGAIPGKTVQTAEKRPAVEAEQPQKAAPAPAAPQPSTIPQILSVPNGPATSVDVRDQVSRLMKNLFK